MNKIFINELQRNKEHFYEELETATKLKNNTNFGDTFGVKITATTREKIFKEAIEIFKLMRYTRQNHYEEISQRTIKLSKRIKLHFYQMKKLTLNENLTKQQVLKENNYKDNVEYFTNLLRVIYSFLLKKNLLFSNNNINN